MTICTKQVLLEETLSEYTLTMKMFFVIQDQSLKTHSGMGRGGGCN